MKTAVSLPDRIFEDADQLAKRLGMSRSQLYATAIEAYVQRNRNEKITEALDRAYGEESSSLDRVVAAMQRLSIPRDEW